MTAVGICLLVLFFFCFISVFILSDTAPLVGVIGLILTIITIFYYSTEPTAMDVYQDKTELKKIYINGLCVDSCVIYKDID